MFLNKLFICASNITCKILELCPGLNINTVFNPMHENDTFNNNNML